MRFNIDLGPEFRRNGKRRGRWNFVWDDNGPFGSNGPFGANGPFGENGPFGDGGPFGDNGPFGARGPFGGGRGGGGGRRGGGRIFGNKDLRLVVLQLLAEAPRHGYELIKEIGARTGGHYEPSPGTIYPLLAMLSDEGLIEPTDSDEARKPYRLTAAGEAELAENSDKAERLAERMAVHSDEREQRESDQAGAHDVMRAFGNLVQVVRDKFRHTRIDVNSREELVDLIDELAKKIERL